MIGKDEQEKKNIRVDHDKKTMCVIGAGWYGIHIALVFARKGYKVTILEKNKDIASQISGIFGIRDHVGSHYPLSPETRKACYEDHAEFDKLYKDLLVENAYSLYVIGGLDADDQPSKVSFPEFLKVIEELDAQKFKPKWSKVDPQNYGLNNVHGAVNVEEPTIVLGDRLRGTLRRYLQEAGVNVVCNYKVLRVENLGDKSLVTNDGINSEYFDVVVNATGCRNFLPQDISTELNIDLVYQVALGLVYEDQKPTDKPFSTIIMYGRYPCILPLIDESNNVPGKEIKRKYVVTHGKWTITKTFTKAQEANRFLDKNMTPEYVENYVKPKIEEAFARFWPEFLTRFKYKDFQGCVIPKLSTERDFRAAVTFEHDMIHVIPGKVSGVISAAKEVEQLVERRNVLTKGKYKFVQGGVYHSAVGEISEKPSDPNRSTYSLQTYDDLIQASKSSPSPFSPDNVRYSYWSRRTPPGSTVHTPATSRSPDQRGSKIAGLASIGSGRKGT